MSSFMQVIERLEGVIDSRRRERPEGSYVTRLLEGGEGAMAAKLREEAEELIEAGPDRSATAHEAADLMFHTLVLLGAREVPMAEVCAVLERRFGTGGLVEKASRAQGAATK